MDEPFSGVDIPSQEAILEILDGLREQGVTVLVSTTTSTGRRALRSAGLLNHRLIAYGRHAGPSLRPRCPPPMWSGAVAR